MDVLKFAKELSQTTDPVLDRWSQGVLGILAERILQLARFYDDIPQELQAEYLLLIESVLDDLPDDIDIQLSPTLAERLKRLGNQKVSKMIDDHRLIELKSRS